MTFSPRVSVVVPAFDASGTLASLLECLRRQTVAPREVIVVDDGSRDDTARVAETGGATVIRHRTNLGPGRARNSGVEAAAGDVVIFTDADCLVDPDWIERSLAFMAARGARVTTSGYLGPVDADLGSWFQHWEKRSREPREPATIRATNGHSLCVERSLYLEAGGMSALPTSEDFLFGLVVSELSPVHFDPDNGVYHRFRPGLSGYFRQKMRFARNTVLSTAARPVGMRDRATFSPWKTLLELGLTLGALGGLASSAAAFMAGSRSLGIAGLTLAVLLSAARGLPFILYLHRVPKVAWTRYGRPPDGARPLALSAYGLPWLLVRDLATTIGLLRGLAARRLGPTAVA